jgi:hypothetical protein
VIHASFNKIMCEPKYQYENMFFSSKNAFFLDKIVDFHYTNYYNVDTLIHDNSLLQIDTQKLWRNLRLDVGSLRQRRRWWHAWQTLIIQHVKAVNKNLSYNLSNCIRNKLRNCKSNSESAIALLCPQNWSWAPQKFKLIATSNYR